ncbi:MAG: alpha/beta fold hydrolase [Pseudomonadota bacterium]
MNWRDYDTFSSHNVPSTHLAGLRLHVRTHCDDTGKLPVLCVHGATIASRFFDIPHPEANWLRAIDSAGLCAYAMDVRGYGRSVDPRADDRKVPFARAAEAILDIDDVVRWISERHGTRVMLVGGSWGAITAGLYTSTAGADVVERLVFYAPVFSTMSSAPASLLNVQGGNGIGAFRRVSEEETRARWDREMPGGEFLRDEAVFQALIQSTLADDDTATRTHPPTFRAPNGTLLDLAEVLSGQALYDPAAIYCPTLIVRGGLDPISTRTDALGLFDRLGARDRRYLEIANGTHFVSAERLGRQVLQAVVAFLAEGACRDGGQNGAR